MGHDLTINNPYLKGAAEMYEDGLLVTVDLKFMVDAHICVFEDISSYGRYLCFNNIINCHKEALRLAHMLLPPSSQAFSPPRFLLLIPFSINSSILWFYVYPRHLFILCTSITYIFFFFFNFLNYRNYLLIT